MQDFSRLLVDHFFSLPCVSPIIILLARILIFDTQLIGCCTFADTSLDVGTRRRHKNSNLLVSFAHQLNAIFSFLFCIFIFMPFQYAQADEYCALPICSNLFKR